MINILIYFLISLIVGVIIHLLDNRKSRLTETLIASVLGGLTTGIIAYFSLDNSKYGVSISSILLVTSASLFVTLLWKMLYRPKSKTHTQEYYNWLRESNRYAYVAYSDIRIRRSKEKNQIDKILDKVAYPVSKRDLVKFAGDHDASQQTLTTFEKLPDHIYDNAQEIKEKI